MPCRCAGCFVASRSAPSPTIFGAERSSPNRFAAASRSGELRWPPSSAASAALSHRPRYCAATRSTITTFVPPIATFSGRGNSSSKPSPSIAGAPSASSTSGASSSSTSTIRSPKVSTAATYFARASASWRLMPASTLSSSRCDRHFCRNAGDASEYITVPCMPLMPSENTEKRCVLIFGIVMNRPWSRCSARIFATSNVGTCDFAMPVIASGLPGCSPCVSNTPSSSSATSVTPSSRAIAP